MFTAVDAVIIYVKDIKRAKEFYCNILGLHLIYDDKLFVSLKVNRDDKTKIALNAEQKEGQYPGHQTVILRTSNIEKVYKQLKDKVSIVFDLSTQTWGKIFIFTDPDGNKIEVVE